MSIYSATVYRKNRRFVYIDSRGFGLQVCTEPKGRCICRKVRFILRKRLLFVGFARSKSIFSFRFHFLGDFLLRDGSFFWEQIWYCFFVFDFIMRYALLMKYTAATNWVIITLSILVIVGHFIQRSILHVRRTVLYVLW